MAVSVVMPALEMAQETGKIVSWLKKEGDKITKGEPLLEVETDKAVVEIEAPGDGVLAGVKQTEGAVVPVGQTIAWIVAPGEKPPAEEAQVQTGRAMTSEQARPSPTASKAVVSHAAPVAPTGEVKVSPKARRLAKELGVDLSRVKGTGPDGTVTSEDVEAASKAPAPAPAAAPSLAAQGGGEPLSAIGRLMAERTTQSWTQAPHFFLVRAVDATALNAAREKLGPGVDQAKGVKLTHTDLLLVLTSRVLLKHPKMNASWAGNGIKMNPAVNIGVAVAVPDGVVSAVIPNSGTASLVDIAAARKDLAERAKINKLRPADLSSGTFTISNLGMYGIDQFNAIIVTPQAAILAVGKIADRVVPVDGKPGIRPMLTLTLSSDHRVVDGAQAALFLNDLAEAIAAPEQFLA
jgi:pyruvate dehydrogenase E2 component (dihydrolipoyllysine-residue acetyltransferase)